MRPYVTVTYGYTAKTVNITNTTVSVSEGTTKTLTATTSPSGQTGHWQSSNEEVATVSTSGVVTGVNSGTATITAYLTGGGSDICTVYVVKADGVYYLQNVASNYWLDGGGANIAPENLTKLRLNMTICIHERRGSNETLT